jgi:haloalkane dehalogenase
MGTAQPMSSEVKAAYNAPFPSNKFKAGAKAFPLLVPAKPDDDGVKEMKHAREVLKTWEKPALVMFSDKDPIMRGGHKWFMGNIPFLKDKDWIEIKGAGHFLQEDKGEEIAQHIFEFMQKTA